MRKTLLLVIMFISVSTAFSSDIHLDLDLSGKIFIPGSPFQLNLDARNAGPEYSEARVFIAVNIGTNDFWFYPSWAKYPPATDFFVTDIAPYSNNILNIIPPFLWPEDVGEFFNAAFYAAVISNEGSLISNVPVTTFGWTTSPIVDSIYPLSGPPGQMLMINGWGLTSSSEDIRVEIGGYDLPVVASNINSEAMQQVITVVPPLESGSYDVTLVSGNLRSQPVTLFIQPLADTGKPPGQVIDEINLGMTRMMDQLDNAIIPSAIIHGLIPEAARDDFSEAIRRARALFDVFYEEIEALSPEDKAFFESLLVQNGLDEIFAELTSHSYMFTANSGLTSFYWCVTLDATSAVLTTVNTAWNLVSAATLVKTVLTGGAALPVAASSFGLQFALTIIDSLIDGFIPTDLTEIYIDTTEEILTSSIDEITEYRIKGYFNNQTPPLEATFEVFLNTYLETVPLPQTVKEEFRWFVIGKIADAGLDYFKKILGEDIMKWGDPPPHFFPVDFEFYIGIDMNRILTLTMFGPSAHVLYLLDLYKISVLPDTSIVIQNPDKLTFSLDKNLIYLTGKESGETSLTFNAFRFSGLQSWWNVLNLEFPEQVTMVQGVKIENGDSIPLMASGMIGCSGKDPALFFNDFPLSLQTDQTLVFTGTGSGYDYDGSLLYFYIHGNFHLDPLHTIVNVAMYRDAAFTQHVRTDRATAYPVYEDWFYDPACVLTHDTTAGCVPVWMAIRFYTAGSAQSKNIPPDIMSYFSFDDVNTTSSCTLDATCGRNNASLER